MAAESLQNQIVEWAVLSLPSWSEWPARILSHLGGEYFYLLALPLLFWFTSWTSGLTAVRAVVLADLLGEWIKWTFDWPRPSVALVREDSPGFVSTHAALSLALAACLWRKWPKARPLLALWVLGVGWSRLRLGVHYPLDIIGGWFLGFTVGLAVLYLEAESRRSLYLMVGSALAIVLLWPAAGFPSWHRDLGLLLGVEMGATMLLRQSAVQLSPLSLFVGLGRMIALLVAYLGMKALAWPALLRYFLLGLLVCYRSVPGSDEAR